MGLVARLELRRLLVDAYYYVAHRIFLPFLRLTFGFFFFFFFFLFLSPDLDLDLRTRDEGADALLLLNDRL